MDFFDRQKRISGWNQENIGNMTAVCFGVGGLGSVVAINLCRIGIGKIILMDYDVVEVHNLNRQLLFAIDDIGKFKVDAAKESLEKTHNLVSRIEAYNIDIVKQWGNVLRIIEEANVIFNMIDYGDYFDLAVQSLCLKKKIPFVQGGTFSQCINVDFFPSTGGVCLNCSCDLDKNIVRSIGVDKILDICDLGFLPKNKNPIGLSNTYLCGMCGMMMTAKFGEYLMNMGNGEVVISNKTIFYVNSMESVNFNIEPNPQCSLCSNIE